VEDREMTGAPRSAPPRATIRVTSLVLVNTGEGKGKTTAALGTAMRAAACGWRVAVIQFLKSGGWKVGEETSALRLGIEWWSMGDGFTWDSPDMDATEAIAHEAWAFARGTIGAGKHRLVVLDEITYPIAWGWIRGSEVADAIRSRPAPVSVIVTGRDAPSEITAVADTVTEMVNRRHAFDRGIRAFRGIDF
jgi:cob(I)alamin adenosyltransferase